MHVLRQREALETELGTEAFGVAYATGAAFSPVDLMDEATRGLLPG